MQHRKELGLTRKELAQAVGVSVVTIGKIELGQRRPSTQVAELLAQRLRVPATERESFIQFARTNTNGFNVLAEGGVTPPSQRTQSRNALWKVLAHYPNNLPAPATQFIGRQTLVSEASALLKRPGVRLLSLTGPPGIGKTRLGLEVAVHLLPAFRDGAFFVALAPIRASDIVVSAIAQVLKVRAEGAQPTMEKLKEELHSKEMLLVLDNFEQVISAGNMVAELLKAAPSLRVLVTSRAALHIYGEYEFAVPLMDLPAPDQPLPPLERLLQYDAINLFVERAQAANRRFALNPNKTHAVAQICARLEGLPLALELAAAHIKTLSPESILSRLESRFELLAGGPLDLPPRQQALRSAIDWSYDLLNEEERTLFRRLSVFVGGCTPEAGAVVSGSTPSDADQLGGIMAETPSLHSRQALSTVKLTLLSLCDKSLLREEDAGEVGEVGEGSRFWMLETLHAYAADRLAESGEAEEMHRRHAQYYSGLAEAAESQLTGPKQAVWLNRLEREHDNFRAALTWTLSTDKVGLALRMGIGLWRFWVNHGHLIEGLGWIESILALSTDRPDIPAATRAYALNAAGNLARNRGDHAAAYRFYSESLSIRRELGDKSGLATSLSNLGNALREQGNLGEAASLLRESLSLKRELGDKTGTAPSLNNLAIVLAYQGQYEGARKLSEEALSIWREVGNRRGIGIALTNLGNCVREMNHYNLALTHYQESLHINRELGDKQGASGVLYNLGEVEMRHGNYTEAGRLYEESLVISRELNDSQGIACSMHRLGFTFLWQGDVARAEVLIRRSLALFTEHGLKVGIIQCLIGLASVAAVREQPEGAARMFGAAQALIEQLGYNPRAVDRMAYDRYFALAREQMSEPVWEAALAEGRGTPELVLSEVLGGRA